MADFEVDVSAWVAKARARAQQAFQAIALAAVAEVKTLTPVDTGYLRSNWTATLEGQTEPVAGSVPDPAAVIATARVGDVITIINPVVYARRIEYGFTGEDRAGRTYHQEGRHMVAQTVAEMPSIAERAIAQLRGAA